MPDGSEDSVRDAMAEKLITANRTLEEAIRAVKNLSTELRPGVLDKFGLAAAAEWQCEEFENRTGIRCTLRQPQQKFRLSNALSTALFRILQEGLTNVARHSDASQADVELDLNQGQIALTINDNGRGITKAELAAPDSLGLLGMRERIESLGGSFSVGPRSPRGTTIVASVPISTPSVALT
jgi:signal transduction histidine kinase